MIAAVRHAPDFDDPQADKIAAGSTWSQVLASTVSIYRELVRP
jgi:hypothetical protein